jgi:hypothetical protein
VGRYTGPTERAKRYYGVRERQIRITGKVRRLPQRGEIDAPVNEQLIVELSSRV